MFIIGGLIFINGIVWWQGALLERERTLCRVYTENGIPNYMVAGGERYDLDIYGNPTTPIEFVNPWVYDEVVNKAGCIILNTRKE